MKDKGGDVHIIRRLDFALTCSACNYNTPSWKWYWIDNSGDWIEYSAIDVISFCLQESLSLSLFLSVLFRDLLQFAINSIRLHSYFYLREVGCNHLCRQKISRQSTRTHQKEASISRQRNIPTALTSKHSPRQTWTLRGKQKEGLDAARYMTTIHEGRPTLANIRMLLLAHPVILRLASLFVHDSENGSLKYSCILLTICYTATTYS